MKFAWQFISSNNKPQRVAKIRNRFRLFSLLIAGAFIAGIRGLPGASTTPPDPAAIVVPYTMPANGKVTLGLFDSSDRLLKWLVQDEYRYAGPNSQSWNGLDQWGNAVRAGSYNLKAAYHPLLSLDYQLTLLDPGTPPWPTADRKGDWLSDEATPQAVATDGKWIFLASPGSEKGFAVIGLDEKGQRQWGASEYFNPRSVALAVDGDDLYVLYSGPEITDKSSMFTGTNAIGRAVLVCLNKKTGLPVKFTRENPHLQVATWPYRDDVSFLWDLRNKKAFSPFNYGGQPRYSNLDLGVSTDALGIAVVAKKIYITMPYENKLLTLDADTGTPTGNDISVPSPAGICNLNDHSLLVVSNKQIVKVDVTSKQVVPFITSGLEAPDSITRDISGTIYVSDWGPSFQVKAFDRTGKFIRAFGTPGGRPWVGKWNPKGMLLPRGIAVTDQQKLWVAEDDGSPKRVSVWNTSTGALIHDYLGPAPYGGGTYFWIDPKDPTEVHAEGTRFKVDYRKKTSIPTAIDYRRADRNAPFTPNGHSLDGRQVRILYHAGQEYAFAFNNWKMVSLLERQGDIYQPVAALGSFPYDSQPKLTPNSDSIFTWDSDIKFHVFTHYFPDFFAGEMQNNYVWSDTNGDHLVQPDEMQWAKTLRGQPYVEGAQGLWKSTWDIDIAPNFSVFFPESFADRIAIMRLDVQGWTPSGAPIYDLTSAKAVISLPPTRALNALHVTNDGKLIVAYNYEADLKDNPNAIECFTLDGKSLWSIAMPNDWKGKDVHANCVAYDYDLPGIGDVVCTWLYHGSQRPYFFTTDGLYVGTVLDETLLGPAAIWSESSRYFYQSPTGTPYIVNGASQQEHIFKIKGLEGGGRVQGTFTLNPSDVDRAAQQRKIPQANLPPQPVIRIAWLKTPPKIDGDLTDWEMNEGIGLVGAKGRTAKIALGRDEKFLYLAGEVHESTVPLTNGGTDWRTLFISGDCIDLLLGTDPQANPDRRDPVSGDERLLLGVYQKQPIAILYKPVSSGNASPIHLGSAQIDNIIRLTSATVVVKRTPREGTYSLEARIPLRDLNIGGHENGTLRGDLGVIYADDTGRNRAQRLYYYNHDTAMVADLPTEAHLQPSNWGPILFPLGPNLIQNGSFEQNLVTSREEANRGWFLDHQENGSDATLTTEESHSGQHSFLMETRIPLSVPAAKYDEPDYDTFIKGFNNGAGGGHAEVMQKVPVIGGHLYSLRYFYRNEDFQLEQKDPGHPRGYIAFAARIEWNGPSPDSNATLGIGDTKEDHSTWQEMLNYGHGYDLPHPYLAPDGATFATILFELATNAEDHRPRVCLDDVEMVDVTPPLAKPPTYANLPDARGASRN